MTRRKPPNNSKPRKTEAGATRFMSITKFNQQKFVQAIKRLLKRLGFKIKN